MATEQKWTYYFYDLLTNVKLAELPLSGVGFSSQLNGTGSFRGVLNLVAKQTRGALGDADLSSWPSRTAIYVDLDGELMWGGILWTARYDHASQVVELGGQDFWSYFGSRRVNWNAGYTNVDQFLIFEDLIDTAQSENGGDIGVITPGTLSGVLATVAWDASQLIPVNQAATSLTQQPGSAGFDFAIDVAWDNSDPPVPQKYLTLSYPRRGRIAGTTGIVFDADNGWNTGLSWPVDGSGSANVLYGIGAGTGPPTAANGGGLRIAEAYAPAIAAGYPLLENTMQRSDVTDIGVLRGLTITQLAATAFPIILPSMTFGLAMPDPQFGSYLIGDDALVRVPANQWFPEGHEAYWRVAGWEVTPGDEGAGSVALSFAAPPLIL